MGMTARARAHTHTQTDTDAHTPTNTRRHTQTHTPMVADTEREIEYSKDHKFDTQPFLHLTLSSTHHAYNNYTYCIMHVKFVQQ